MPREPDEEMMGGWRHNCPLTMMQTWGPDHSEARPLYNLPLLLPAFRKKKNQQKIGFCLSSLVSLLYNLYIQWYNKPSAIWQTLKKVHKHEHSNILHTCMGEGGRRRIEPTEEKTSTKHTGSKKGFGKKTERYAEKLQYITFTIYRHVASAGAVAMATAKVKRRAQRAPPASYMQWRFVFRRLKCI